MLHAADQVSTIQYVCVYSSIKVTPVSQQRCLGLSGSQQSVTPLGTGGPDQGRVPEMDSMQLGLLVLVLVK